MVTRTNRSLVGKYWIMKDITSLLTEQARKQGINPAEFLKFAKQSGVNIHTPANLWLDKFITIDKQMLTLKDKIRQIADTNINVLIVGETGTGKEIIANALHGNRPGEFLGVNCTAIQESLLEAELFGATKGSYTGCSADRIGNFEFCQNGTIFLDEIGDMPKVLQSKLLRVIENREIRRLGSNNNIKINCRFVAATNYLDLSKDNSRFRPDLYWRLNGIQLHTKPIRERRYDIPAIARFYDKEKILPDTLFQTWVEEADLFPFFGNARELKNLVESQVILNKI